MTRALRLTLTVVAAALALAGLTAGYVKWELAEPEAFAERGVNALQSATSAPRSPRFAPTMPRCPPSASPSARAAPRSRC